MRRFVILNIILAIIYLTLSNMFLYWREDYLKNNYAGEFQNFSFEQPVDVVNTGTSHGSVSFNWKSVDNINGVNLGRSGQPFSGDLSLLNRYSSYLSGALVIVPVSFSSFCISNENFTPLEALFEDEFPFLGMVQTAISIDLLMDLDNERAFPPEEFLNHEHVKPGIIPKTFCDVEIINENIDYLTKIIESNNVILVTTPYYYPALGDISKFDIFYQIIQKITVDYEVDYYDFSRDSRFYDYTFFYDPDHLNTKGRELFTNIVYEEILKLYLNR